MCNVYYITCTYESRGCDVIKYRGSFYNIILVLLSMKSIYNFRMIPDDGSRLKIIENGVLREERESCDTERETLHCYFYKIIYNITKYLLILLLLGNPSVLILLLSLPSTHQIYISFFFVFLFFNSYTSFILYIL